MSAPPTRVLVVDDDPEILALVSGRLRRLGYEVGVASDGQAALDAAWAAPLDAVVLDVMMPGKNGWEVARELRQDARTKDVAIVVLSAIGARVNELTSPLYADDFLDKPFEFAALEQKLNRAIAARRAAAK